MEIKRIATGAIEENCYLVWDEANQAVVIDPGDEASKIIDEITKLQLDVKKIILTHGHYDHVGAVNEVKKATGAQVICHQEEKSIVEDETLSLGLYLGKEVSLPKVDACVSEGDEISVGNLNFSVIHTPGHTKGGMCLLAGDSLFSGDTIFYGTLGRWDFPTGDLSELTSSITRKIFNLPEDTVIYSGHGPETTVGAEKRQNEVYRWLSI